MKISAILTPLSDHHLRLAAQVGVTDIVATFPGLDRDELLRLRDHIQSFEMRLSVIERFVPHTLLVHGRNGREEQLEGFKTLIRNMGAAGVSILCYNWMPYDDWSRTSFETRNRGGALVTEFDLSEFARPRPQTIISEADLWKNYQWFLQELIPVAEQSGVSLALHPDDPPISPLAGQPQIMISSEALERAANVVQSPAHGICFCQGTLASGGEDVLAAARRLAPHIRYIHFRNVRGTLPHFCETFQDNGDIDMVEAMRTYKEIGFDGPIRPDHVPTLDGEKNESPGYEMLGRLYAVGYMKGLMQALDVEN